MNALKRLEKTDLPSLERARMYVPAAELLAPAKRFFADPRDTWLRIFANSDTFKGLFERYVFFLAAVPPVAGCIGSVLSGRGVVSSLLSALALYLFSLAFVYFAVHLAYRSIRVFGGRLTLDTAGKLVVYSLTPVFLSGVFFALRPISWLSILGVYGLFLFYKGVEQLTGISKDKLLPYYIINIIAWVLAADFAVDFL